MYAVQEKGEEEDICVMYSVLKKVEAGVVTLCRRMNVVCRVLR